MKRTGLTAFFCLPLLSTVLCAQQLSYQQDGLNWGGLCVTSSLQSPVNIVASRFTAAQMPSTLSMTLGTGTNVSVHNLGNQVRVTWTQATPSTATTTLGAFFAQPDATGPISITGTNSSAGMADAILNIVPTQFHFHTTSEHTIEGRFAALETHLVANVTGSNTSCANTCTAVFAVLYDFSADDATGNDFLAPFLANIPPNVTSNNVTHLGSNYTLNLTELLPMDTSQYVHYTGSLTTPPCTEGVSWTIFTETQPISVPQVQTLSDLLATAEMDGFVPERTDNRLPQPLYNRTLWSYGSTMATA